MDEATIPYVLELGHTSSEYSDDPFDSRYFFQRVIVLIQRYNPILFQKMKSTRSHSSLVLVFLVFNPGIYTTWGKRNKIIINSNDKHK